MAITEVGNHSSGGTGTAISDTHGLTIAANDVVVALCFEYNNDRSAVDNNGAYSFTEFSDTNWYGSFQVYSRVAGASEPSSYAFTSNSSDDWSITTRVFRGVDTTDVWDVSAVTFDGSASGTAVTNDGSTTDNAGALALFIVDALLSVTFSSVTNGFAAEKLGTASGNLYTVSYTKTIASAGAVGTTGLTLNTSSPWTSQMCALRAAVDLPVLTTTSVSAITATTATSGGTITDEGGSAVTDYGVCWNTTGTPTIADSHTHDKPA